MIARLVTAAPALVPLAGLLVVGIWAIAHAICSGRRRGPRHWTIRDPQHYANEPKHPRYAAAPARKEKP